MKTNKSRNKIVATILPLVSIIVPTYNRRWILPRALKSLVTQSYENIEILVINDGGEDVQDIIDSFNDRRIKYFVNSENKGLAATRNVGLNACKGDFISLLDDDDIYLPYTVEFRVHMAGLLRADVVYTRSLQDVWKKLPDENGQENRYQRITQKLYWDSPFDKDRILTMNIAPCCNVMFSRKAWEKTGKYQFDVNMTTTEDHDLWIALSRHSNFEELKLVDTECSLRQGDNEQMTGNLSFVPNWIITFKRWRHTALDLETVTKTQNDVLRRVGVNPEEHGL